MDKDAALERITRLRNIIEYHNKRYYQQDDRKFRILNTTI